MQQENWPGTPLSDNDFIALWETIQTFGLVLSNITVKEFSIGDLESYLSNVNSVLWFAYLHPTLEHKRFASLANKEDIISFIKREFDQDTMEGLDLAILPEDKTWCVFGNHDGEIFHAS
ncbi:MAG: hypothetical protein GFH27_549289n134 [Chloroflexi bacterium AL-W]|nr:hypothetical protein [Chloroflexi bacterium AL-N1]NOK66866.1 hypothetical protein [Chloroflexi bacterium AL-N10]NOK74842.1 hypothetical protein [Chloroflexi bacterium AL-N5]NOK81469.1 hypothetical protein [Chloroflexi bacterium AL-W]NOK88938.1 hypothetical protein [Chloroflexi bacterium AL-N15]